MKKVLILIKTRSSLKSVKTTSAVLKNYLEDSKFKVDRDYIGYVNFELDSARNIWSGKIRDKKLEDYDLIYLQTAGNMKDVATTLVNYCAAKKIRIIEGNFRYTVNNSKLIQMYKLFTSGICIPKTYFFGDWFPSKLPKFPLVAKRIFGSGGDGVSLVENKTALRKLLSNENGVKYIFQEYIANDFDWRIVVIAGRAVYSAKRVREAGGDFRNNVRLGAKEVVLRASSQVNRIAIKSARSMGLVVAGVDVIENKGKEYVIEVNRAPSFTTDVVFSREIPALAEYIKKCTNQK